MLRQRSGYSCLGTVKCNVKGRRSISKEAVPVLSVVALSPFEHGYLAAEGIYNIV